MTCGTGGGVLVVEFERPEPGPTPDGGTSEVQWLLAAYDFVLQPKAESR